MFLKSKIYAILKDAIWEQMKIFKDGVWKYNTDKIR